VFGLAGFLLTNGFFFEPKVVSTAISFFVLVSYGGALLAGVAPWQKGISWDGHLYGFAAGALTAYLLAKRQ
jgi:membrane associated rhomboid family serine protease